MRAWSLFFLVTLTPCLFWQVARGNAVMSALTAAGVVFNLVNYVESE